MADQDADEDYPSNYAIAIAINEYIWDLDHRDDLEFMYNECWDYLSVPYIIDTMKILPCGHELPAIQLRNV